ncbi:hypothetical protein [Nocardioides pelophilus]|uniref:hypothetical protein n=1 Tax=Nocardioides pelophilus TaxID=2172019 RepID=UPI0016011758|nr:hypothetical protein [Nocardioides pelophilus]
MNSTPSRLEQHLARLLPTTPPPTVGRNPLQPRAKVDFVYLTGADQDRLDDTVRQ